MTRGRYTRPPASVRRKVIERDDSTCQACWRRFADTDLEVDHVTPLGDGGSNRLDNLVTLCRRCHARKTAGGGVRRAVLAAALCGALGSLLYGPVLGAVPWVLLGLWLMARAERQAGGRVKPLADEPDVPRETEPVSKLPERADRMAATDPLSLPIAIGDDGEVISWEPIVASHILVAGRTNSGKTVALRTVVEQCLATGWKVFVADPKRVDFTRYRQYGVQVATTREAIAALISDYWHEQERRYEQLERDDESVFQRWLLVLDEAAEGLNEQQEWWKAEGKRQAASGSTDSPALVQFRSLARKCRQASMHLAVGIQRPDVEFLPGDARANLGCRISLSSLDEQGARMMWGRADVGRDVPKIKGRGYVDVGDGPVPAQTLWTPPPPKRLHLVKESAA